MKITELNDRAEAILKSNIEILYSQLQLAIKNYVRHGHSSGEFLSLLMDRSSST